MKRATWAVVGAVLLLTATALPTRASDSEQGGGELAFTGVATLPNFPCPPPTPGSFPCTGTWQGTIAGTLSGVHEENGQQFPWAVEIVAPAAATFSYFDLVQPGVPCTEGFARAIGTALGELNQVFGAYANALPVPAPVTRIDVSFRFDWRRVGVNAVMRFTNVDVKLTVLGVGERMVMTQGLGTGTAVFTPHMEPAHLEACETGDAPDPAEDMDAEVHGAGVFHTVRQKT